jgi:undecaprenyl-diphosphatase
LSQIDDMSTSHAVILGAVQGLGEFLPISSSGHLIVVPWLLGWVEHSLAFDVALHVGTLVAVLYAFAGDWWRLVTAAGRGALRGNPFAEPDGKLLGLLALASVPGGIAGLALEKWADTVLRAPLLIAATMSIMGAGLLAADRMGGRKRKLENVSISHALFIGISQAAAIVPGVSRSGVTIAMARALGYEREDAARFSFLLATPIICGAALVKVPELVRAGTAMTPVLWGMVAAAVFGLLSIRGLLSYVRSRSYTPFVYYRFLFSAVVVTALLLRR